ncbi:hypothetical protein ACQUFO_04425 [Enterococcus casseliflavus]|uniref:PTS sugar transporter subunit IIA domain-containing protein n=1 Tax=Enterococcus casseliflavus TaxID=37734 RepID=UPI003D0CC7BF
MQGAIDQLKETCDGVVICADLVGGTPFNVAMTAANEDPQVEVIGGSNLLMLVEGSLTRYTATDPEGFCQRSWLHLQWRLVRPGNVERWC